MRKTLACLMIAFAVACRLSSQSPLTFDRLTPPLGYRATVHATATFNDGSGEALFAGGNFEFAGGMSVRTGPLAKWNGLQWSGVGAPIDGEILAIATFHDGTEEALYVGGNFAGTGALSAARNLLRWNGTTWSALPGILNGAVRALVVYNDGSGPALYAGGEFSQISGMTVGYVAKWNGIAWTSLTSGVGPILPPGVAGYSVSALTVHDDGGGPGLYAAGNFLTAGSQSARSIARWRGGQWSALGAGLSPMDVLTCTSFGGSLYAGGSFDRSGTTVVERVARWNGSSWLPVGAGFGSPVVTPEGGQSLPFVRALRVFDDGSGAALYAAGRIGPSGSANTNGIARFNGSSWVPLGSGVAIGGDFAEVMSLTTANLGGVPTLVIGGYFDKAGGIANEAIATWRAGTYGSIGLGLQAGAEPPWVSINSPLKTRVLETPSGRRLFLSGSFTWIGTQPARHAAVFDGVSWSALGSSLPFAPSDLAGWTAGGSLSLFAVAQNRVWRYTGTDWTPLPVSPDFSADKLAAFDSGSGPSLHAIGWNLNFFVPVFARWNGTTWVELGGVAGGPFAHTTYLTSLSSHDSPSGPRLLATGRIHSSQYAHHGFVWSWDGTTAESLGELSTCDPKNEPLMCAGLVTSAAFFNLGAGPRLFASGNFGGQHHVATFNGSTWQPLGTLAPPDGRLLVFDHGFGPELHLAHATLGLWRFDGTDWVQLPGLSVGNGSAETTYDDGGGRDIILTGSYGLQGQAPELGVYASRSYLDSHVRESLGVPVPVLAISNGSSFSIERSVVVPIGASFQIRMTPPGSMPAPADFLIFAMLGAPEAATLTPTPFGIFTMPLPYPGGPTLWLVSSVGNESFLLAPPAPWTWTSGGISSPMVVTLQGAMADNTAPLGIAITNGIVLHVRP